MKHVIREIKIANILNTGDISNESLKVINFFDNLFDGIQITKNIKFPDSLFFVKYIDNQKIIYMEQDNDSDHLWCDYDKVWSFFETFNHNNQLKTIDIQTIIKYMVEKHLNSKVSEPLQYPFGEEQKKVSTPLQYTFGQTEKLLNTLL